MSALCTVCNRYPCPGCLGAAQDEVSRLRSLLSEAYHELREPENGVHYCRGCSAGTHNAWKHDDHCHLERRRADVILLRSRIRAAIDDSTVVSPSLAMAR